MLNPKDFPFLVKFISHSVRLPEGGPRVEKLMATWLQDPSICLEELTHVEASAKTLSEHPEIFAHVAVNGDDAGEEWEKAGEILGDVDLYVLHQVEFGIHYLAFDGGNYSPEDGLPDIW